MQNLNEKNRPVKNRLLIFASKHDGYEIIGYKVVANLSLMLFASTVIPNSTKKNEESVKRRF